MYALVSLWLSLFLSHHAADDVLKKTSDALNNLHSVQYNHKRELNYPSRDLFNVLKGEVYFDFTSADKVIGTRYLFEARKGTGNDVIIGFNGSESFICSAKTGTIEVNRAPVYNDLENLSFLNHSMLSIKKAMPWIISDKSVIKNVSDTVIEKRSFYSITLFMKKAVINTLGEKSNLTDPIDITYRITVDKGNYIPVEVYQTNSINKDFLKTDFTDIRENKELENESVLYYTSYLEKYKEKKPADITPLVKSGQAAPAFSLVSFSSKQKTSLPDFKGKLVLLDFWICHCGPCIAGVKDLNALQNKYKYKNFKLLSINAYDPPEMISKFNEKQKVNYEVLQQGEAVRLQYGVSGFPTVVLIDKQGTILYAGEFDNAKIEALINKNL